MMRQGSGGREEAVLAAKLRRALMQLAASPFPSHVDEFTSPNQEFQSSNSSSADPYRIACNRVKCRAASHSQAHTLRHNTLSQQTKRNDHSFSIPQAPIIGDLRLRIQASPVLAPVWVAFPL